MNTRIIKGLPYNEYHKQLSKKWVAQGLCRSCGERPPAFLSAQCQPCLDRHQKHMHQKRGKARIEAIKKRHAFFNPRPRKQQS